MYRYQQLSNPTEVRLLKLHRSTNAAEPTKYSIEHTLLENAPDYETVSYVWGHPKRSQTVKLLDGATLAITPSVLRALPHLSAVSQTGYLWIDQITINQSDLRERSDQVRMMGEIYSQCNRCLIWIDSDPSIATEGRGVLRWGDGVGNDVRTYLQSFGRDGMQQLLQSLSREEAHDLLTFQSHLSRPDAAVRDHLLWFLEHPWFSRVWVYQEFVLPSKLLFLMDDFELPGEELENVFRLSWPHSTAWFDAFHRTFDITKSRAASFDKAPGMIFLVAAHLTRRLFRGPEVETKRRIRFQHLDRDSFKGYEPCTFMDMVHAMSSSNTTDPRDHIYAFIGLAPFLLRHMRVDYTMPVERTFALMLKAFVKSSRSLDFLVHLPSEADISRSRLDLPSWVPDWTAKSSTFPITCQDNLFCASGRDFGVPLVPGCMHYDPASSCWVDLKWNEIKMAGQIIDTVKFKLQKASIYQVVPDTHINVERCTGRLPWDMSTLEIFVTELTELQYPDKKEFSREALLRTLFMDGVQWAALDALRSGESLYRRDMRVFDLPHHVKIKEVIGALLETETLKINDLPYGATIQVLHELSKVQYQKRIIFCEGERFGLAPDTVQEGDTIVLLHGSRTPIVLRPQSQGTYKVIGQCYYDGAMYGELANPRDDAADIFKII